MSSIKIRIDVREPKLIQQMQQIALKDVVIVTEALPIGDIIIETGTQEIIIERKTILDLCASIKDGRYDEQSYRLNGSDVPNHNIYYLIEGDIGKLLIFNKHKIDKQTIYSALFSLSYFKGFSVIRSFDIYETAFIIMNMANKLLRSKGKSPFYKMINNNETVKEINKIKETENENENDKEIIETEIIETEIIETENENIKENDKHKEKMYCNVVKKVKKDNITSANIGEIMLAQIPGISGHIAITILEKFKTLPSLIKSIQEDEKCLDDIYTKDSKNKLRKLSKTVIAKLIMYLKQ